MGLDRVWLLNPLLPGMCSLRLKIHVTEQETTQNSSNNTTWNPTKEGSLRTSCHGHKSWEILTEVFGQESCLPLRLKG